MSPYLKDGRFIAGRRSEVRCSICERHFERGFIPVPEPDGRRICRDCRIRLYGAHNYRNDQ